MKLQFDVAGVDLNSVRAYSYKYFLDGNTNGSPLHGVVAEEHDGYFVCSVDVPTEALATPETTVNGTKVPAKTHSIEISVTDPNGESVKSSKLNVEAEKVLPAPVNLRVHKTLKTPPINQDLNQNKPSPQAQPPQVPQSLNPFPSSETHNQAADVSNKPF